MNKHPGVQVDDGQWDQQQIMVSNTKVCNTTNSNEIGESIPVVDWVFNPDTQQDANVEYLLFRTCNTSTGAGNS